MRIFATGLRAQPPGRRDGAL